MIKKIFKDEFFKNNALFFAASMLVAVLNYLYHPVLGRMMSVSDFGEVQALMSIFMQFGVVFGVFNMLTINLTANLEDQNKKALVIRNMQRVAIVLVGLNFLLFLVFRNQLRDSLQFASVYPFISLALIYVFSVSFTFRKAYLQGIGRFWEISWAGIIVSGGRLLFAAILVYLGSRTFGAITGLLIAQILAFLYVYILTRQDLALPKDAAVEKFPVGTIKNELSYAFLILVANGLVTLLYTADVVMVKHLFSPESAGLYGGVATIARIIFFATGSVAGVMLPSIKLRNEDQENFRVLKKSLVLVLGLGGAGLLAFMLFPDLVIRLMIGQNYLPFAHLLGRLSILAFLVSIINLLYNYLLALRRFYLIPVSLLGAAAVAGYLMYFGETIEGIINSFIFGSLVILILIGAEAGRKRVWEKI